MSWEFERDADGHVTRVRVHADDWLCSACGQTFPADSKHTHDRIICCRGTIPEIPMGRKPVPELDRWLQEHKPGVGG